MKTMPSSVVGALLHAMKIEGGLEGVNHGAVRQTTLLAFSP